MAFVPVPNVVNVYMEYLLPNLNLAGNSLWIRDNQAGILAPRLDDLRLIISTWYTSSLKAQVSNTVALRRINLRDMTVENGEVLDFAVTPTEAGGLASPALPANVTFATSFRTGLAGRSFRGRVYHVGLAEGQVNGDFVAPSTGTAILAAWNLLRGTALPAGDFQLVVASRVSNGAPRVTGVATPVTSCIHVDLRVDTQRRRLIGEGS